MNYVARSWVLRGGHYEKYGKQKKRAASTNAREDHGHRNQTTSVYRSEGQGYEEPDILVVSAPWENPLGLVFLTMRPGNPDSNPVYGTVALDEDDAPTPGGHRAWSCCTVRDVAIQCRLYGCSHRMRS